MMLRRFGGKIVRPSVRLVSDTVQGCPAVEEGNPQTLPWNEAKSLEEIPGPKPLPIIGNLHRFLPIIGKYYKASSDYTLLMKDMYEEFGPIVRLPGMLNQPTDTLFLFDPLLAEQVFRMSGPMPVRNGAQSILRYRKELRNDFFQDVFGITVTQKEEWQHFRKIVNKVMLKPQVTKQYLAGINKVAEDFIERIKDIRNDKNEMPDDFANELNKWGLESVSFVAVNTRLGCLGKNLAEDSEPQKIIRAIQESLRLMYFLNGVPNFSAYYPTRRWREYVKHLDTIFETIHKILINTTEEVERNPKGENEEKSIFERLIEIDKKVALVMALDMIQAGVDTTSALVSKVLYMLAVNPEKQERLRQELAEFAPDGKITAANQDKLVYLRACIRETNRIIPVAPGNQRIIEKDTVLGGYQIPKGTSAVLCHMTMSNMEKYFDNPEEFRPERWLRSDPNWNGNISKFISLPFGHGARSCIGRRIAEMEIETLISQLVTNFDIYWHHEPLQFKTTLLHIPASPLKYKFVDRQK